MTEKQKEEPKKEHHEGPPKIPLVYGIALVVIAVLFYLRIWAASQAVLNLLLLIAGVILIVWSLRIGSQHGLNEFYKKRIK